MPDFYQRDYFNRRLYADINLKKKMDVNLKEVKKINLDDELDFKETIEKVKEIYEMEFEVNATSLKTLWEMLVVLEKIGWDKAMVVLGKDQLKEKLRPFLPLLEEAYAKKWRKDMRRNDSLYELREGKISLLLEISPKLRTLLWKYFTLQVKIQKANIVEGDFEKSFRNVKLDFLCVDILMKVSQENEGEDYFKTLEEFLKIQIDCFFYSTYLDIVALKYCISNWDIAIYTEKLESIWNKIKQNVLENIPDFYFFPFSMTTIPFISLEVFKGKVENYHAALELCGKQPADIIQMIDDFFLYHTQKISWHFTENAKDEMIGIIAQKQAIKAGYKCLEAYLKSEAS